jgi:hypothetical protein
MLPDMMTEKPPLEILLKQPLKAHYLFGITKKIERNHIRLDDPTALLENIREN